MEEDAIAFGYWSYPTLNSLAGVISPFFVNRCEHQVIVVLLSMFTMLILFENNVQI